MRKKDLLELGIPRDAVSVAFAAIKQAIASDAENRRRIPELMREVAGDPTAFLQHQTFGALAELLVTAKKPGASFEARETPAPWRQWGGADVDARTVDQLRAACELPVTMAGALMPDAHLGYGLPIGGVLATRGAVIPYAVGVDIACRMKLTVLDLDLRMIGEQTDKLRSAIERQTAFGIGARFSTPREHPVMDLDWTISPVTRRMKDRAWTQLGSSGSGNHFVEFGEFEVPDPNSLGLAPGTYLALLSHSGSRGTGAAVCKHYSKIAADGAKRLPKRLRNLAWLDLDSEAGQEYWAAMNLMGAYASANHACIHRHVAAQLGASVLADYENHHNFAWEETHQGETVIVHRKGATPAGVGDIGIIPGTMADTCFLVRGKGQPQSLNSAAHGAGRKMSRTAAKKRFSWAETRRLLAQRKVELMSAGLDEAPMAYKDIHTVMAAQQDLVEVLASFTPRLVKMAPPGERAED